MTVRGFFVFFLQLLYIYEMNRLIYENVGAAK